MPKLVTETIGTGDQSWLAEDGPHDARSQALLMSAFTAGTHYPNGYVPSGLPIAEFTSGPNSGEYGPYDPDATDGTEDLVGFVLTDTPVNVRAGETSTDTHLNVALIDRGRININRLPVAFAAPADPGHFVFLTQS
jgi:hypothetical protein